MKHLLPLITIMLLAPVAAACNYTVRDIGFVEFEEPRMRLVVLFAEHVEESQLRQMQRDLNRQAGEPNCRAWNLQLQSGTVANLTAPSDEQRAWSNNTDLDWSCWLVRNDGADRMLSEASLDLLPKWERLLADHLQFSLASTYRERALRSFANIVLFESTSDQANQIAEGVIAEATAALDKAASLLPRPIANPIQVIRVEANQRDEYETLMWTLHSPESHPDEPIVCTLYGLGRLAGPTLQGETLEVQTLLPQLVLVGQSCECGTRRNWVQYPQLPIAWSSDALNDLPHALGFDPSSSQVIEEVKRIIQRGPVTLPNGRDDVSDVVRSTLSLGSGKDPGELSATVIQGGGWDFDTPETDAKDPIRHEPKLVPIPMGRAANQGVADANVSSSETGKSSAAAGDETSSDKKSAVGQRTWRLWIAILSGSLCVYLVIRRRLPQPSR
ncbi:hypothetical protein EC9_23180 [Rosistilla ulvae]|uniref:Uncharacterized protein n=1 Tax=Rosistilla ulvae TaxID=1930277 RepID=A0A517LZU0_9BACT|nr:hypothetical protein [Rosistilla ulvae]QDS88131.1 hypothetical protein EC9_23180 [Rosistilla ulvae]